MPIPSATRAHKPAMPALAERVPFRFFRSDSAGNSSDSYEKFMMASPHNRGGQGKLPKTDAEALAMINAAAPRVQAGGDPYKADDFHIHYLEAANSNYIGDRYMFLGETTLRNIASDAADGFAFMNSHRTGGYSKQAELPIGRSFCGRFETLTDDMTGDVIDRTAIGVYMLRGEKPNGDAGPSTDSLHNGIDAGTIFDCSVGLYGGEPICDICGNNLYGYEYDQDAGYFRFTCRHLPGTTYGMSDIEVASQEDCGIPGGVATFTLEEAHCGETSAVYDGAVPGAGFSKVELFAREGELDEGDFAVLLPELEAAYASLMHLPGLSDFAPVVSQLVTRRPDNSFAGPLPAAENVRGKGEAAMPNGTTAGSQPRRPLGANQAGGGLHIGTLTSAIAAALAAVGIGAQPAPAEAAPADNNGGGTVPAPAAPAPAQLSPEDRAVVTDLQTRLSKAETDLKAERDALATERAAHRLANNEAWIDRQVKALKITPAAATELKKLAAEKPDALEALKPALEANAPIQSLAGGSGTATGNDTDESAPALSAQEAAAAEVYTGGVEAARLDSLAKEYAKKNGCSYIDAFGAICRANPELAAAYRAAATGG